MLLGVGALTRAAFRVPRLYAEAAREISAYLRSRKTPGFSPLATADVGGEHLAIVNGVHVTALFVTDRAVDVVARARSAAPVL